MKKLITGAVPLLVSAAFGTAYGQLAATNSMSPPNYNSMIPPGVGSTYVDPVFGATVKRVSNALATPDIDSGGYLTWIENEYSTMSAFNNDNSKFILLHQSYFALYNGSTGLFIQNLPLEINSSSEPRWARNNLTTLYYHYGNQLKSYNVATGGINVVHTFSQYSSISGLGEMDISLDGDHMVFVGNGQYVFVYQISADKVYPALNVGGQPIDAVYITPHNEVIIAWIPSGTSRFTGQELFDINMNFLRQLSHADGHKHLTVDTNGQEVLIWTNSNDPNPIANCQNGIVKINLATAAQTCLLQLDWSLAVHITAPDGNGTAFVDTEAPGNPAPGTSAWVPYTNEIIQVKLDGSGAMRWAQHRSRPLNSYNWQPKLTVSRDGTRLLYASNFDLENIYGYASDYSDEYLIVMGASTGVSNTGSGSGTTSTGSGSGTTSTGSGSGTTSTGSGSGTTSTGSTTTRYEQNSSAVSYTGTWYPNSGSFNSGGSATLAMDAGSQAKLTFTGTAVKWIGFSDPWSGIATVSLDGVQKATVNTYSAVQQAQKVQYSVSGLTNSTHTLTINVTGTMGSGSAGAWVWVDAFDVTSGGSSSTSSSSSTSTSSSSGSTSTSSGSSGSTTSTSSGSGSTTSTSSGSGSTSSSSTPVRYEQNSSAVQYSGTWYGNSGSFNSGGSAVLAMDAGSQAKFTFSGSGVKWIGFSDPWSGIATLYLDGVLVGTIDTYSAVQQAQKVQYSNTNLANGTHTLTIKVNGQMDANSQGEWVWVDAFEVY